MSLGSTSTQLQTSLLCVNRLLKFSKSRTRQTEALNSTIFPFNSRTEFDIVTSINKYGHTVACRSCSPELNVPNIIMFLIVITFSAINGKIKNKVITVFVSL